MHAVTAVANAGPVPLPANGRHYVGLLIGGDLKYTDFQADILKEVGIAFETHWHRDLLRNCVEKPFPPGVEVVCFLRSVMGHPSYYRLKDRAQTARLRFVSIGHKKADWLPALERAGFEHKPRWLAAVRMVTAESARESAKAEAERKWQEAVLKQPMPEPAPVEEAIEDEEPEPPSPHARLKAKERGEALPMPKPTPPAPAPAVEAYPRYITPYKQGNDWSEDDDNKIHAIIAEEKEPTEVLRKVFLATGSYRTSGGLSQHIGQQRSWISKLANPSLPTKLTALSKKLSKKRDQYLADEELAASMGELRAFAAAHGGLISRKLVLEWMGGVPARWQHAMARGEVHGVYDRELELYCVPLDEALAAVRHLRPLRGSDTPLPDAKAAVTPRIRVPEPAKVEPAKAESVEAEVMPEAPVRLQSPRVTWPQHLRFGGGAKLTDSQIDKIIMERLSLVTMARFQETDAPKAFQRLLALMRQGKVKRVGGHPSHSNGLFCLPEKYAEAMLIREQGQEACRLLIRNEMSALFPEDNAAPEAAPEPAKVESAPEPAPVVEEPPVLAPAVSAAAAPSKDLAASMRVDEAALVGGLAAAVRADNLTPREMARVLAELYRKE